MVVWIDRWNSGLTDSVDSLIGHSVTQPRRLGISFRPTRRWIRYRTSDAGSQYRCGERERKGIHWQAKGRSGRGRRPYTTGRVGRGIQPPSTPQTPLHTKTYIKSIRNAHYSTFRLDHLNGRTDGPTNRQTKPIKELRVRN